MAFIIFAECVLFTILPGDSLLFAVGLFVAGGVTRSIHSIITRRRELFYRITVLTSFALGTSAGDFTANERHLGYLASAVIFAVAAVAGAAIIGLVAHLTVRRTDLQTPTEITA